MKNQYKPSVKALVLIHTALLVGQIISSVVFYFFSKELPSHATGTAERIIQVIVVLIALSFCIVAFTRFIKTRQSLQQTYDSAEVKLPIYTKAFTQKLVLLDVPAMCALIGYFLTQNLSFFLLYIVLLLVFAGQKPTVTMMMYDMNVSREDFFE